MSAHKERAHSKLSASGSERWLNCAASVGLAEESPKSPDSVWSVEGTTAHEILEKRFRSRLATLGYVEVRKGVYRKGVKR